MRKWDNGEIVEANDGKAFDYSGNQDAVGSESLPELKIDKSAFTKERDLVLVNELNDILNESDDEGEQVDETNGSVGSGFFSKISSYLGGTINVDEVSKKFREQLITKTSPGIATTIIDKIKTKLSANKKLQWQSTSKHSQTN